MPLSIAEENYLKGIFHLQQPGRAVSTNDLATRLQTKPASVTGMLKRLQAKDLLVYEKYYGVSLSEKGLSIALQVIRRHRLWECFLFNHLKFGWAEIHDLAEKLEHIQSTTLTNSLDSFLNHPRFDPHGDPIPDEMGKMDHQPGISLLLLDVGQSAQICGIGNQTEALLEVLMVKKLQIGTQINLVRRFLFDKSLEITTSDQTIIMISEQLAHNLLVKIITD